MSQSPDRVCKCRARSTSPALEDSEAAAGRLDPWGPCSRRAWWWPGWGGEGTRQVFEAQSRGRVPFGILVIKATSLGLQSSPPPQGAMPLPTGSDFFLKSSSPASQSPTPALQPAAHSPSLRWGLLCACRSPWGMAQPTSLQPEPCPGPSAYLSRARVI